MIDKQIPSLHYLIQHSASRQLLLPLLSNASRLMLRLSEGRQYERLRRFAFEQRPERLRQEDLRYRRSQVRLSGPGAIGTWDMRLSPAYVGGPSAGLFHERAVGAALRIRKASAPSTALWPSRISRVSCRSAGMSIAAR